MDGTSAPIGASVSPTSLSPNPLFGSVSLSLPIETIANTSQQTVATPPLPGTSTTVAAPATTPLRTVELARLLTRTREQAAGMIEHECKVIHTTLPTHTLALTRTHSTTTQITHCNNHRNAPPPSTPLSSVHPYLSHSLRHPSPPCPPFFFNPHHSVPVALFTVPRSPFPISLPCPSLHATTTSLKHMRTPHPRPHLPPQVPARPPPRHRRAPASHHARPPPPQR